MPKSHDQEILDYLCRPETLPQVLTIVQHAPAIRLRLWRNFWTDVGKYLDANTPKSLQGMSLRWELGPGPEKMADTYSGVHFWDGRLQPRSDFLAFFVYQGENRYLYYGIDWEAGHKDTSPVWKLPAVMKLKESLSRWGFKASGPDIGQKVIYDRDSEETFLLEYRDRKEQILREISELFWALVKDTFELVDNANRAIRAKKD